MIVFKSQILWAAAFLFLAFNPALAQDSQAENEQPTSLSLNSSSSFLDYFNLIHFGDLVDVDVVGSTEFDWRGEVTPEGFLGGLSFTDDPVYALCRNTSDVASEIRGAYAKFLNNPSVNVQILDKSKRPLVTLYGAVRQPQRFRLTRQASLKELIVLTGGFSENASGEIEIVSRPMASCRIKAGNQVPDSGSNDKSVGSSRTNYLEISIGELLSGGSDADPIANYGDIITVQTARPVYVIGAVANPGRISYTEDLTVSRAISAAGGISGSDGEAEIRLFRRNATGTDVILLTRESGTGDNMNSETFKLIEYDIVEVFGSRGERVKYPPVLKNVDNDNRPVGDLPIRVVD